MGQNHQNTKTRGLAVLALALALVACSGQTDVSDEQGVLDVAWKALEPNTSSHDRGNWEVVEVRRVTGREVAEQFEGRPASACPGPKPPDNRTIKPSVAYWYVDMKPRLVTPIPEEGTASPTAPSRIPEPFTRRVLFLIDPADGHVVARKLHCVIY